VDHTVELVYGSYDLETYVWGFTGTTDANRRGLFLSGQNPPLIEIIPEPSATPLLFALAALLLMRRRRK
ncbi:MAG: PEP-CTERM sorting domain-containing protein, partial [Verrucomicrobiota bacterium]